MSQEFSVAPPSDPDQAYTDFDGPGESSVTVVTWAKDHKGAAIVLAVVAVLLLIILFVAVPIGVLVAPLLETSLVENSASVSFGDLCQDTNMPISYGPNNNTFATVLIEEEIEVVSGEASIQSAGLANITDETLTALLLQDILNQPKPAEPEDYIVVYLDVAVSAKALGIGTETSLYGNITFGPVAEDFLLIRAQGVDPAQKTLSLQDARLLFNSAEAVSAEVNFALNLTSNAANATIPQIYLQLRYSNDISVLPRNRPHIAEATVYPFPFAFGPQVMQAGVDVSWLDQDEGAKLVAKFVEGNGDYELVLQGREGLNDECMIQRLANLMTIVVPPEVPEAKTAASFDLTFLSSNISNLTNTSLVVDVSYGLTNYIPLRGLIPAGAQFQLLSADTPIAFFELVTELSLENGTHSGTVLASIPSSPYKPIDFGDLRLLISGRSSGDLLLSRLVSQARFNLTCDPTVQVCENSTAIELIGFGVSNLDSESITLLVAVKGDVKNISKGLLNEDSANTLLSQVGFVVDSSQGEFAQINVASTFSPDQIEILIKISMDVNTSAELVSSIGYLDSYNWVRMRGLPGGGGIVNRLLEGFELIEFEIGGPPNPFPVLNQAKKSGFDVVVNATEFVNTISIKVTLSFNATTFGALPTFELRGVKKDIRKDYPGVSPPIGADLDLGSITAQITMGENQIVLDLSSNMQPYGVGTCLGDIMTGLETRVFGTGQSNGRTDVLSAILDRTTVFLDLNMPDPLPYKRKRQVVTAPPENGVVQLALSGAAGPTEPARHVYADLTVSLLDNTFAYTVPTPRLEFKVGNTTANPSLDLWINPVELKPETVFPINFDLFIEDPAAATQLANDLLGGVGRGPLFFGINTGEKLAELLSYIRWYFKSDAETNKVAGGVFPKVDVDVTSSTADRIEGIISLPAVDFGIPFPIHIGNVNLTLYQYPNGQSPVAFLFLRDFWILPGPGTQRVEANITLTAEGAQNRLDLEDIVSNYVFGSSFATRLHVEVNSATWPAGRRPLVFDYNFTFPEDPGGPQSSVIKCIELSKDLAYSTFDVLLGSCDLTTQARLWMANPLPWFPLTINSFGFQLLFDDTVGVSYLFYGPRNNILFDNVDEPSPAAFRNRPPVTFGSGQLDFTGFSIDTSGSGSELCFRLNEAYSNARLILKVRQGYVDLQVFNFHLHLAIAPFDTFLSPESTECWEKLGLSGPVT